MLLEQGADVNIQGGKYDIAIQAALLDDEKNIVPLLLEWGVDVNSQGREYGSALQAASFGGK